VVANKCDKSGYDGYIGESLAGLTICTEMSFTTVRTGIVVFMWPNVTAARIWAAAIEFRLESSQKCSARSQTINAGKRMGSF
jgi:hypothetical protein